MNAVEMMIRMQKYQERYDHYFIASFGFCKAEIPDDDEQMKAVYAAGLWGFAMAAEERAVQ